MYPYVGRVPLLKLRPEQVAGDDDQPHRQRALPQVGTARPGRAPQALKQAEAWGKVHRNAAALTQAPTHGGLEARRRPDAEERPKVLVQRPVTGWRRSAVLVLTTGLRQGEALALRWDDIDLAAATVTVRKSKTAAGVRTIALPEMTVRALKQHRRAQLAEGRSPAGVHQRTGQPLGQLAA